LQSSWSKEYAQPPILGDVPKQFKSYTVGFIENGSSRIPLAFLDHIQQQFHLPRGSTPRYQPAFTPLKSRLPNAILLNAQKALFLNR
jgi:hypothetical protein